MVSTPIVSNFYPVALIFLWQMFVSICWEYSVHTKKLANFSHYVNGLEISCCSLRSNECVIVVENDCRGQHVSCTYREYVSGSFSVDIPYFLEFGCSNSWILPTSWFVEFIRCLMLCLHQHIGLFSEQKAFN